MNSKEFVASLAKIMGVEKTELATVDRALAKAGLRKVAKGRYRPDIALREGLQIVLAWAGARNLTMAAEEIKRVDQLFVQHGDHDLPPYARSGKDSDKFRAIYGTSEARLGGEMVLDVLERAARSIGKGNYPAGEFKVRVQKNGAIDLIHREGFMKDRTLMFPYHGNFDPSNIAQMAANRLKVTFSVEIPGQIFKWIYDVTEGA